MKRCGSRSYNGELVGERYILRSFYVARMRGIQVRARFQPYLIAAQLLKDPLQEMFYHLTTLKLTRWQNILLLWVLLYLKYSHEAGLFCRMQLSTSTRNRMQGDTRRRNQVLKQIVLYSKTPSLTPRYSLTLIGPLLQDTRIRRRFNRGDFHYNTHLPRHHRHSPVLSSALTANNPPHPALRLQ